MYQRWWAISRDTLDIFPNWNCNWAGKFVQQVNLTIATATTESHSREAQTSGAKRLLSCLLWMTHTSISTRPNFQKRKKGSSSSRKEHSNKVRMYKRMNCMYSLMMFAMRRVHVVAMFHLLQVATRARARAHANFIWEGEENWAHTDPTSMGNRHRAALVRSEYTNSHPNATHKRRNDTNIYLVLQPRLEFTH